VRPCSPDRAVEEMAIHIGVLGTGNVADRNLVPALQEVSQARFWSVLSRDRERGLEFARRHGAQAPDPVHTTLESMLADPQLHAVIIATPDKLHARQAIACAAAGKHVLVEKPMATDVESAGMMLRKCEEAGVKLAVAYHMRWHNGHRQVIERIRAGRIGTLRHMRVLWTARTNDPGNWRASPEVGRWWSLGAVGTHCLDLIRWTLSPSCGEIAVCKSVIANSVWGGPHDETAILSLRFASGATAELCSSVVFKAPSRLEIYGSGGYVVCDGTLGPHGAGTIRTPEGELKYPVMDPYAGEIRDFVESIQDNRSPEVNGEEGLRNVELLVAATASDPNLKPMDSC
jgi:predicted dehydrogenase